jgi:hypothetical protein
LILRDGGPAAAGAIDRAEAELAVSLPADYRAFLAAHDGVRLAGGADRLYAAAELTAAPPPGFPPRLLAIGEAGGGDLIALDGDAVVQWEHETDAVVALATSFGAWFDSLVPLTDADLPEVTVHAASVKRGFLRRMRRQGRL